MFVFFKQKTAYEMRISDGVQTCALPIWFRNPRASHRHSGARGRGDRDRARGRCGDAGIQTARRPGEGGRDACSGPEPGRGADRRRTHGGKRQGRTRAKRSEEHTSELQSLMRISYAVFCLKKKKKTIHT